MKHLRAATPLFFITAVGPFAVADNFLGSCDSGSVKVSGTTITSRCRAINGSYRCSRLDLNRCLKNNYGSLQADPNGSGPHFGDQCFDCSNDKTTSGILISGPSLVHCQCDPGTGTSRANWPVAIFDLNTIVDNVDGRLACYSSRSTDC